MANEVFLSAVKKIAEKNLTLGELIEIAQVLRSTAHVDLSGQLYKLWIEVNHENPLRYVAYFNYAAILSDVGELAGAKSALEQAIALNPDFYPAYINLGSVLEKLGAVGEAVIQWSALVNRLAVITKSAIDYKTTALKQIGRILEMNRLSPNAEITLRQSLEVSQNQPDVIQHFTALRLVQCEWPIVSPWQDVERKALIAGMSPLSMAAYTDDPMLQLASAWNYSRNVMGYPLTDLRENHRPVQGNPRSGRRRIGYVSSDLRVHAVGFMMSEVFEFHDRNEFEVFVYYCGPASNDFIHTRIKALAEHWVDISGMDEDAAAHRIVADGIDILVDINGYTRDARTKVFALRAAPILVNWFGFPGSMGTPYHHYIIADDWIIPEDHEIYYSEKVMRLPCYQPNDRQRVIASPAPSRADAKLPEHAFVFCCFNGLQKVTRFTFERWLTILARVPDSVLWLLGESDATNQRLRDYAVQRGIAAERVIFADKLDNANHLARYPLADLFLDTTPYGAHVTASDSLWMGVPILTLSGRGFASRVCGSLVRAAGLPELVCSTSEEYIERAVELGTDRAKLKRFKERLKAGRDSCVLFDTKSLMRHLKSLYEQMWEDFCQGRLPIPDLTNLDVYLEIGCEEDHDASEALAVKDYPARYKGGLARRHKYCPLPEDRRLWTSADCSRKEVAFLEHFPIKKSR